MANSSGRLSCHDWIKKMRKQMDISKKDLERDLKREPIKSSNLPVIDLSPSKKQKKKLKKKEKKERYKLAYWYIHQYLKPQYADNIYDYFDNDLDQIVEFGRMIPKRNGNGPGRNGTSSRQRDVPRKRRSRST